MSFSTHTNPKISAPTDEVAEKSESAPSEPSLHADIFTTTPYSPGSPLFHPAGTFIFNKLLSFLRAQYPLFGLAEVITPNIYKRSLWNVSGHWDNYAADMFAVTGRGATGGSSSSSSPNATPLEPGQDEEYGLKPMNCPGHCLLFASSPRTHADLPMRLADFGALHRNEGSGALSGLSRVRRFHQDDAHIFCARDQVRAEIARTLAFVSLAYRTFGLGPPELILSTRPETGFIGEEAEWVDAEAQLRAALDVSGSPWTLSPGDGAFYGPKIDVVLRDARGRRQQTATVQLDFQLPRRFGLSYTTAERGAAPEVPVLIHRAVFGSLERFMALLLEHHAAALPLWLSPRPVVVLPLRTNPELLAYAARVRDVLAGTPAPSSTFSPLGDDETAAGHPQMPVTLDALHIPVQLDARAKPLPRRVADAFRRGFNFAVTVGEEERGKGTVAVEALWAAAGRSAEETARAMDGMGAGGKGRRSVVKEKGTGRVRVEGVKVEELRAVLEGLIRGYC